MTKYLIRLLLLDFAEILCKSRYRHSGSVHVLPRTLAGATLDTALLSIQTILKYLKF